ncbi:MAG: bifunctional DNA-formamidopyrimidine glycosylase/DNA-(apurinic or apyrimidinic site) lyase [Pyrinomonadaceae bacterium]
MPELPEVEHVARSLNRLVNGRKIVSSSLNRERLVPDMTPDEFSTSIAKVVIDRVHRRGKHILFELNGGLTLITHLRMSGRFMILQAETEDPKFAHAVFHLDDGTRLVFQDQRHFGMMKIVDTAGLHETKELAKLAPEPLSNDFSSDYLRAVLKSSNRSLKEILIDQTKVCGLGNIYAAEVMFLAGAHPKLRARRLSKAKAHALFEAIGGILSSAIAHSARMPVDPENIEQTYFNGSSGDRWLVYGRENLPCRTCDTLIVRSKQAGRSSYYCPRCQRR